MDYTQIITSAISVAGTIGVACLQNRTNRNVKENISKTELSDLRTQIMFLILEDHDLVRDGELPENRKDIEELYDKYTSLGGNSHIKRKYKEYVEWIEGLDIKKEV